MRIQPKPAKSYAKKFAAQQAAVTLTDRAEVEVESPMSYEQQILSLISTV